MIARLQKVGGSQERMVHIKAITLFNPWATLMAMGLKKIETRSWATHYRGPLAIHAGLNRKFVGGKFLTGLCQRNLCLLHQRLVFGAIVAIVLLTDCVRITYPLSEPDREYNPYRICARNEIELGDYRVGRYMWITQFQKRIEPPILARGAMGLWDWNEKQ